MPGKFLQILRQPDLADNIDSIGSILRGIPEHASTSRILITIKQIVSFQFPITHGSVNFAAI